MSTEQENRKRHDVILKLSEDAPSTTGSREKSLPEKVWEMSNLWIRLRCWWRHDFRLVPIDREKWPRADGFYTREVIPGARTYERKCLRCGLHQKISTMLGMHFLDRQWNPARSSAGAEGGEG